MRMVMVGVGIVLGSALSACGAPCGAPQNFNPTGACVSASRPAAAGVPFTLNVEEYVGGTGGSGTCNVVVDGGFVALTISASLCGGGTGNRPVASPVRAQCQIPPLPPGTYQLGRAAELTLFDGGYTLDGGLPPASCGG